MVVFDKLWNGSNVGCEPESGSPHWTISIDLLNEMGVGIDSIEASFE